MGKILKNRFTIFENYTSTTGEWEYNCRATNVLVVFIVFDSNNFNKIIK